MKSFLSSFVRASGRSDAVLAWTVVTLLSPHTTSAQEPEAARTSNLSTAQGIVFEDANQNGQRDTGESGIAGVRVSNGREIVLTDAEGRYSLPVDEDDILFVIKPRDWMTPLSPLNLPKFYYIHKPAGSPANFLYPGVDPTGPLPSSVDFALHRRPEPDSFKAILFGDPQPRDLAEVEYIAHDVIEQIIGEKAHDAAFGVTLGDIVFDDLTVMEPLNQAIALIGIPWYNVIGNHDMNFDAESDQDSDETFERHYGPSYYSFDHGPAHFLVLDDVTWHGAHDGKKAHYHGGIGADQMQFIRRDLELIPEDQLVVLMMHIPLTDVQDRHELYRLIEQRPFAVSISAHTHYMEHRLIDKADGWQGPEPHHHIVNVTVCGSWWRGQKDERGIPHATMSDGAPNGYSIMQFDGQRYSLDFHAASRPADYQMNIYAPEVVQQSDLAATVVLANVFNGSSATQVSMRVGELGEWKPMEQVTLPDPAFVAEKSREQSLSDRPWVDLPEPHSTPHLWRGMLPTDLSDGSHLIQIQVQQGDRCYTGRRVIRVQANAVKNLPAAGG